MKGIATIEIVDTRSNEKAIIKEENLVTNALQDYMNHMLSFGQNPEFWSMHSAINDIIKNKSLSDLVGGIMLFENQLEENPNNIYTLVEPLGYAGSSFSGFDKRRGSLNKLETGFFENDDKKGYRWVWDFSADVCNFTFSNLCLTSTAGGNGEIFSKESAIETSNANFVSSFISPNLQGVTFSPLIFVCKSAITKLEQIESVSGFLCPNTNIFSIFKFFLSVTFFHLIFLIILLY